MGAEKYDFAGWATKWGVPCADGRTIMKDAFKESDGQTVPLIWSHNHENMDAVLGHALLEYRPEGIWAYGALNNTDEGKRAKELVGNRDITRMSIYANHLVQKGGDVYHGEIREVSLVLAGANPEARIEFPTLEHFDFDEDAATEAIIYHNDNSGLELYHADDKKKEEEKPVAKEEVKETKETASDQGKTLEEIYHSMTQEQKDCVAALIGLALDEAEDDGGEGEGGEVKHDDLNGGDEMKYNVFDGENENSINHSALRSFASDVMSDMKKYGSFKESFMAHADTYGIKKNANDEGIELLFPDYRAVNNEPDFIKRDTGWVNDVMTGVHHTPFSRIKSLHANITEDEARARGYMKGKLKKEEVFTLLKRHTDPQTIYKKQKLDRDDILDITSFDVVAWIRREMRMMLEEEIARAILIGDGRPGSSDDKINELHVHSILNDEELYSVKVPVTPGSDADKTAAAIIRAAIKNRTQYKGSGNPTLFVNEDYLTDMLLLEDGIGHTLYPTIDVLATKLRVSKIVPVEVFNGIKEEKTGNDLIGIIVNLRDYSVGADRGGEITNFEDFDIDYNQQKYLIETRISGALTKPFSAMVLTLANGSTPTPTP